LNALWVVVTIVVLGLITILVGGYLVGQMGEGSSMALRGGKVGVITVSGVIQDGGRGGLLLGPPGARAIMEDLRRAGEDAEIKAVVLLINSPGGSPAASHAIYQEIQRLRKTKKVVACMTDIAASGGYYISAAADKIVAQNSTLTGSIGVIFGGLGYYGLMNKLGIVDQTQTAGRYKDVGSPLRPMKDYEKELVQGLLDSIYQQFIQAVAEGRQMPLAKVKPLAEGRIYTGEQAKKVGLVDELGNFYDAVKLAGKLGGITGEPKVKYLGAPKGLWQELMATESLLGRHLKGSRGLLMDPTLVGPMLVVPWAYPTLSGEESGLPALR
jgi:protease-4